MATTSLTFDREAIAMRFEWEATPPIVFSVCLAVLCLQSVGVKGGSIMDGKKGFIGLAGKVDGLEAAYLGMSGAV